MHTHRAHTHIHTECCARTEAGGSPWLQLHDNMPLEIAGLLINPADMTASPRGLALWVPTPRQLPLPFLPTNWWRFLLYMLLAQCFFSPPPPPPFLLFLSHSLFFLCFFSFPFSLPPPLPPHFISFSFSVFPSLTYCDKQMLYIT